MLNCGETCLHKSRSKVPGFRVSCLHQPRATNFKASKGEFQAISTHNTEEERPDFQFDHPSYTSSDSIFHNKGEEAVHILLPSEHSTRGGPWRSSTSELVQGFLLMTLFSLMLFISVLISVNMMCN